MKTVETTGVLKFNPKTLVWTISGFDFTVDGVKNSWVVRNLKLFSASRRKVLVKLNEEHKLLMVRPL